MTNFSSLDMPVSRADVTLIVAIVGLPKSLLQKIAPMLRSCSRMDSWGFDSR